MISKQTKKAASGKTAKKNSTGVQARRQLGEDGGPFAVQDNLNDLLETIPNPYDRIGTMGRAPRSPSSAGVPTAVAQAVSDLNFVANIPLYENGDISTTTVGGLVLASNSTDRTRLLTSAGEGYDGIVNLSISATADVSQPSEPEVSGTIDSVNSTWFDAPGIVELSKFDRNFVAYYVMEPDWNSAPAIICETTDVAAGSIGLGVNMLDDYEGLVSARLQGWLGGSWATIITVNMVTGSGSGTANYVIGSGPTAFRLQFASTAPQMLRFHANIYSNDLDTSFTFPNVINVLKPQTSLFHAEIISQQLKEYYGVAFNEIITNETKNIQRAGNIVSASFQKFVGLYNVAQANSLHTLIKNNIYHTYTGPAAVGASGFGFPDFLQTIPMHFSARKFASDVRMYLIECPVDAPQTFVIKYASIISMIGQRTASTTYRICAYPSFWPEVVRAISLLNPMTSNDLHSSLVKKAFNYINQWIRVPGNKEKLAKGLVTGADLVGQAVGVLAPRAGNAIRTGSSIIRGMFE